MPGYCNSGYGRNRQCSSLEPLKSGHVIEPLHVMPLNDRLVMLLESLKSGHVIETSKDFRLLITYFTYFGLLIGKGIPKIVILIRKKGILRKKIFC
jgi:hypothetical protein